MLLNYRVQRRATTEGEHACMIPENSTNNVTFHFDKSLSAQLYHQFTRRQAALIL